MITILTKQTQVRSFPSPEVSRPPFSRDRIPGGMVAVRSSNLAAVAYTPPGTLTIKFHSGGDYEYYRVPYSIHSGLMNAHSHGRYFHAFIKDRYSYRRMR